MQPSTVLEKQQPGGRSRAWLLLRGHFCAASLVLLATTARAAERFPQPQFESDYSKPVYHHPPARADWLEALDVILLASALLLASHLALKRRSRPALVALMLFCLAYFGFYRHGCICPVGAVQNVALALFDSSYAIPLGVLLFFLLPLLFALFCGRIFCGAVCPLGAIQDVVALRPVRVPPWLQQMLGIVPFMVLGAGVLHAATGTGFLICRHDPFISIFRLSGPGRNLFAGLGFLAVGVVVARPYCRFFCPYGVLLGWMSALSRRHLSITPDECIQCRLCLNACPFDAIRTPVDGADSEPRQRGVRRLALLLVTLPFVVGAAGWGGSRLAPVFLRTYEPALIAQRIAREDAGQVTGTTLASRSFRATGKPLAQLRDELAGKQRQLAVGGGAFGMFIGLVIMGKLLLLSVRRRREAYEPDRVNCLSCGRCFAACPREHLNRRRAARGTEETHFAKN